MARVINITEQVKRERPKIVIGDKEIEVNNGSAAYQNFQAYQETMKNDYKKEIKEYMNEHEGTTVEEAKSKVEKIGMFAQFKEVVTMFVSEEDFDYLMQLDLNDKGLEVVMVSIIAAASDQDVEKVYELMNKKKVM